MLLSCDPEFAALALREVQEILPDMPMPVWLDDGIALCSPDRSFGEFAGLVQKASPIFVRHLAPVQREVALREVEADVARLADAVSELADRLDPARTFAVQARFLSERARPYRKFTVNEALSERLVAQTGATLDCKTPDQIVSVLCTPEAGYLGISRPDQNRSDWPGGEHRFKREEGQISRAEFKLLEALDVFGLTFPTGGKALDMGAAPGGWTRMLRHLGLRVIAVDPADLDARFRRDPNVTHVATTFEAFLPTIKTRFDLLVNDMRMDADESVEQMLRASRVLLPGRLALMTLKLPTYQKQSQNPHRHQDTLARVRQALNRLSRDYVVLGARQLYHNRSEVTVALKAKENSL